MSKDILFNGVTFKFASAINSHDPQPVSRTCVLILQPQSEKQWDTRITNRLFFLKQYIHKRFPKRYEQKNEVAVKQI